MGNTALYGFLASTWKDNVTWSAKASSALAVVALILLLPATGRAQSAAEPTWLLALQGEVAAISTDEIKIEVGSRGIAFTDRPERKVAVVDIADFVKTQWGEDGSFTADPPNASLVDENKGLTAIVEIKSADWHDGVLRLMITRLDGGGMPTTGNYVALVIDTWQHIHAGE